MSYFKKKIHTVIGRHFTDATRVIIVIIVLQLQDKKNTITAITIYWLSFCWWGNLEKQFWKQVWYANSDISDFSGKRDLLFLRDEGASRYEEVKILLGKGCRSLFYTHTHTHHLIHIYNCCLIGFCFLTEIIFKSSSWKKKKRWANKEQDMVYIWITCRNWCVDPKVCE